MKKTQTQIKANSTMTRASIIALSLIGSLLVSGPAAAASACKGLENSACSNKSSCGWVEGYQRKDGRSVKSFCRTKSVAKKSVAKKSINKKSTTKSIGKSGK
ncbi:MAG: hypothetical protein JKX81_15590 [Arenicella sp.]|nr:hypothetical protein [Arenicella sp.]